jgi:hypothetical protein
MNVIVSAIIIGVLSSRRSQPKAKEVVAFQSDAATLLLKVLFALYFYQSIIFLFAKNEEIENGKKCKFYF